VEGFTDVRAAHAVRIVFLVPVHHRGFSGVMLAIVPVDFQYNQTYCSGHSNYVLVPGAIFGHHAAVYYWLRSGPVICTA